MVSAALSRQYSVRRVEQYISPITVDLIGNYTIPAITSTLQELITLGMVLRSTKMNHPLLYY